MWLSISRFHIVAIAAMGTLTFGWLFTGAYLWPLVAFAAFDWFTVNILNRIVDLDEDQANAIRGTSFVATHHRTILYGGLALLALSLGLSLWLFAWPLTALRLAYHTLGLVYNWPLIPGVGRLKTRYFWKNTASALGFILTVFLYPLVLTYGDDAALSLRVSWATVAWSALFFFLLELSYEVIYDLRDEEGDRLAGVATYPVIHGQKGAMRIVDGLLLASALVLVLGYALGQLPWAIFVMIAAPAINYFAYQRFMRRGITSQDCIHLTWAGALLLALYHLWIIAGLPGVTMALLFTAP